MKFDWNNFSLSPHSFNKLQLADDLCLIQKEMFGDFSYGTNYVFELDLEQSSLDEVFTKAHRTLMILRNEEMIQDVFMTLEAENKKYFGMSSNGLIHVQCQFRILI